MEAQGETTSLVASLQPWIDVLIDSQASCKLKNPSRVEFGVVFGFTVRLEKLTENDNAPAKLRQAIDLLYRLFAVHTAMALEIKSRDHAIAWPRITGCLDATITHALKRDVLFEMEIELDCGRLNNAELLKTCVADELLVRLSQSPPWDEAYHVAKQQLDKLLENKTREWINRLQQAPILVHCYLETAFRLELSEEKANEFFRHLVRFAETLDQFEQPPASPDGYLPVVMDIAMLTLSQLPLTPEISEAVQAVDNFQRVRFNCARIMLDPRLLTCTREQLRQFLAVMTKDVDDGARIDGLPARFGLDETRPMDSEVMLPRFLPDVMVPIVTCQRVRQFHIGGLLDLIQTPEGRGCIYLLLIDGVFSRSKPMDLLKAEAQVADFDARFFATLVQNWKRRNPGRLLRVQRLVIELYDDEYAFANALIAELDDVEELSIHSQEHGARPISTDQISRILEKFRSLRALSITNVHLTSMQIFREASPPTLQTLELSGLRLDNRSSFLAFIQDLGFPERPLAQKLRRLAFRDLYVENNQATFHITEEEVHCFAQALQTNRVLEKLEVVLAESNILKRIPLLSLLMNAGGSTIPAPRSGRQSTEEKARRLGFLSVLHAHQRSPRATKMSELDRFLIHQIFTFSDAWASRSINAR